MQQGISLTEVLNYLDQAVGENKVARSEIYFSTTGTVREKVEQACRETGHRPNSTGLVPLGPLTSYLVDENPDEVQVCLRYGPASRYYGDLYEAVRKYEIDLHNLVRDVLVDHYGLESRAWWYEGVPLAVRKGCVERAEELMRFDLDPWSCTYMLDLQSVLKEQWVLFDHLYKVAHRNTILGQVKKINAVRNRVMHPIRDSPPTNGDFDELKDAYDLLRLARKRFYGAAEADVRRAK